MSLNNATLFIVAWLFCLGFSVGSASAQIADSHYLNDCKTINASFRAENFLPSLSHFVDTNDQLSTLAAKNLKNLKESFRDLDFQRVRKVSGQYAIGDNGVDDWFSFCLINEAESQRDLVFKTHPGNLAEVDFLPQKPNTSIFQTGYTRPYQSRDIHGAKFDFQISLAPGETQTFFVRIRLDAPAFIQAELQDSGLYQDQKSKADIVDGIYAGILICAILYALFLCFWGRQLYAFWYFLWCSSNALLLIAIDGRLQQFVRTDDPKPYIAVGLILYPLVSIGSAFFARAYIELERFQVLDKVGLLIVLLFALSFPTIYWLDDGYALYFKNAALFMLVVSFYFGTAAPIYTIFKERSVLAQHLLLAHIPLLICSIDRGAFTLGITPNYFIPYTPKVGLWIFMVLMAIFTGIRAFREKQATQLLALNAAEKARQLEATYNLRLEQEVTEKTNEISQINHALMQQSEQLVKLDQAKSTFFTNVSHEFRTPITLIQGRLNQLLENPDLAEKETVQSVITQSENLKSLVDKFLLLSKFDDGSLKLNTQRVVVSQAVKSIYAQFHSLAEDKQIDLTFEDQSDGIEAHIDVDKFHTILNNLINNAVKFTPEGGKILLRLSTTMEGENPESDLSTDEYVSISLANTGVGIAKEDVPYLFDRFFQAQSSPSTSAGIGTGIGLTLVKELAELHAGSVQVLQPTRELGANAETVSLTEFVVTLPLGSAHLSAEEMSDEPISEFLQKSGREEKLENNAEAVSLANNAAEKYQDTVLIVDDNPDIRAYLASLLQQDYRLLLAKDGNDALELSQEQHPDLIVTDLMMPQCDGLTLVSALKANPRLSHIPVIVLTAKASIEDRLTGLEAQVDDYLAKPFDARELRLKVKNLLSRKDVSVGSTAFHTSTASIPSEESADSTQIQDKFTQKAYAIVQTHFSDTKFGVNELAEKLHVSRSTLHRRLSDKTGQTASEFIRHFRLQQAQTMVSEGKVGSLKELAAAVGFNQAAYFSRLYQKTYQTSPFPKE